MSDNSIHIVNSTVATTVEVLTQDQLQIEQKQQLVHCPWISFSVSYFECNQFNHFQILVSHLV